MRRALIFLAALTGIMALSLTAQASDFDPNEMVFPVDGEHRMTDSFGDCRGSGCSRSHEGVDIMADKGVPVVAAADGVVKWIGSTCCYLAIDHGDGWETWYIHLNNDTKNDDGSYSDDGQGDGIADGIEIGAQVSAGQLIGWVGDSGNAEWTSPHLHFELRKDDVAIDPYGYLVAAESFYTGQFYDDDDSVHEADIDKISAAGITKGCNPPDNNRYCPDLSVTRGQMAAFIRRWLQLPNSGKDYYSDDGDSVFEDDINALTEAGVAFGCDTDSYCPDTPLLREEFAEMFTRAFGYTNPEEADFFTDDDESRFEDSINALKAVDVTYGCNPPDNTLFCPNMPVSRAQMASFFVRALDL